MWTTLTLVSLIWVSTIPQISGEGRLDSPDDPNPPDFCENVFNKCYQNVPWTRCYENSISSCRSGRGQKPNFFHQKVKSFQKVERSVTHEHSVEIPVLALQKSSGNVPQAEVILVITVLNSTYFKVKPPKRRGRKEMPPDQRVVMGESVLVVKAGTHRVANLSQPIKLIFKNNKRVKNGSCVFWQDSEQDDGAGEWRTDGCHTSNNGTHYICSCNHLSFFAVLVNPDLSVDTRNAAYLTYITYIGSALSVVFTAISLILYICVQRRRPEKSMGLHMQLTGALLCLHLSFLVCNLWVYNLNENEEGWFCRALGLILHWSLLATISWTALEGFHLYLLLVRVFNIYVSRYLLKLSLVGWGLPTLITAACGISGVYGKYSLIVRDSNDQDSIALICWMSSQFPHRILVSYVTTVAFPCLVILYNSCMLGLVAFKMWRMREGNGCDTWNKAEREKGSRLWKDCATVLGLSCMLGLPWWLASATYISIPGIYIFTIVNSLQGVFVFLWSMALTKKSQSIQSSSSYKDSSSQKMMTTSFNNQT